VTEYTGSDGVRADAITIDLKTDSDEVSTWLCEATLSDSAEGEHDHKDVENVVLLFAAVMERLDKVSLVLLPYGDCHKAGCTVQQTPENGFTEIDDLKPRHHDIQQLDMSRLCWLANTIAKAVRDDNGLLVLYSKRQVADIVWQAIRDNRLSTDDLREKMRTELIKLKQG